MPVTWITELLAPGRELHDVGGGLVSALNSDERGSPYDRQAATYDRLVGNRLYNRLVWGTSPVTYAAFADTTVADSDGPLLDVDCGTAVFTSASYRSTERSLILVDRSLGMLRRAAERLQGHDPTRVAFVQADLFDLPFQPASFATVACHGLLHLFDDPSQVIQVLRSQVAAAGTLYTTSLVAETAIGTRALRLLHRIGEAAVPRSKDELVMAARSELDGSVHVRREGSMTFLHWP
ncbi:MAG: class I SAM-dependent methyltransferase [Acidimicrobiales bacterium]